MSEDLKLMTSKMESPVESTTEETQAAVLQYIENLKTTAKAFGSVGLVAVLIAPDKDQPQDAARISTIVGGDLDLLKAFGPLWLQAICSAATKTFIASDQAQEDRKNVSGSTH